MKVPRPPGPPPPGEKDKTITRRTVKGAAGGMKGVDYEDDRRPELDPASAAAASRARALVREVKGHEALPLRQPDELERGKPTLGRDVDQLVLEDERAAAEEARKKQRRRHVARDRFAVDKDAPELVRKRKWIEEEDDDEAPDEERPREPLLDLDAIGDLVGKGGLLAERRARLFTSDARPEPGDPSLTDPDEIQRALETPVAYAKHAMILAEAFRRATGATRAEGIDYLAKMFVAPTDRAFGRLAIKELGPSTGVLDLYPLEVVAHVLDRYPGFLPKAGLGRFVRNVPATKTHRFHTDTKTPIILEYPEELKIRGFAIVGGGRPGYTFEPDVEPGKYRLHIESPGKFEILISAINRAGHTLLDRIQVRVRAKKAADLAAVAEPAPERPRDPAKVAAWPVPKVRPIEPADADDEAPSTKPSGGKKRSAALTTSERVRMTQLDAMRGPLPGRMTRLDDDAPLLSAEVALPDEDAEVLRAAVAAVLDQVGHLEAHAAARSAELAEVTQDLDEDTQASVRVEPAAAAPAPPTASVTPASSATSAASALPAAKAPGFAPRPVRFDDDDTGGDDVDDELDATDALDRDLVAKLLHARALEDGLLEDGGPRAEVTETELPVADAAIASQTRPGARAEALEATEGSKPEDDGDEVVVRPVDPSELREPEAAARDAVPIAARTIDESDAIFSPLAADLLLPPPATAIVAPQPPAAAGPTPAAPKDDPILAIEEVDDLEEIEDFELIE